MKIAYTLFLLAFIYSSVNAGIAGIPVKWGKISKEEMDMKYYEGDSTANAVVLYSICEVNFSYDFGEFKTVYDVLVRIKILNKAGFSNGEIEIPYVAKNDYDIFKEFSAHTLNFDNEGNLKEISVDKSLIFDINIDGYYHTRNFTFPDLREGSILEYHYKIYSENQFELKKWDFQGNIPTAWSEYRTKIPEVYRYHVSLKGTKGIDIVEYQTTLVNPDYRNLFNNNNNLSEARYVMKNVPSLEKEPFSYSTKTYRNSITLQLKDIDLPIVSNNIYIKDWDSFGKYLLDAKWFGGQLKQYSFIKDISEKSINKSLSAKEQIEEIYNFIRNNYAFNGNYNLYIDDLKKTNELKSGNGTEINALLLCLLRASGINADPVIISTRNNGVIDKAFPVLNQFDHFVVKVKLDTTNFFLDATESDRPFNLMSMHILGVNGYVLNNKTWEWVTLKTPNPIRVVTNYNLKMSENGEANGKYSYYSNSYQGIYVRNKIKKEGKEKFINEIIYSKQLNLKTDSVIFSIDDSLENKISIISNLSSASNTEDKFIYVSPLLNPFLQKSSFVSENRKLPVEFDYPSSEISTLNLVIPDGYKVDDLPKNEKVRLQENGASFTLISSVTGNNITLKSTFLISKIHFEVAEYSELMEFFSNISKILSQQIVLSKTSK